METPSPIETEGRILASKAIEDLAGSLDNSGEDDLFVSILRQTARLLLTSPQVATKALLRWTPIRKMDVLFLPDGTRAVDIRLIPPDDRSN